MSIITADWTEYTLTDWTTTSAIWNKTAEKGDLTNTFEDAVIRSLLNLSEKELF